MSDHSLDQTFEKRNAETSQFWQEFAGHRQRLTTLLQCHRPAQAQTLCVLGAGNCNDLDLPSLLQTFRQITLVDLDSQAMAQGVARQLSGGETQRIECLRLDVTGAFDRLNALRQKETSLSPADLEELASLLQRQPAADEMGRQFDFVISTCLLSQLIDAVRRVVGEAPQRFVPLVQLLRRQHIETLLRLTAAGGTAGLVFDFVSSVTYPALEHIAEQELSAVANQLVSHGNFFTGLKPSAVLNDFGAPHVSSRLAEQAVLMTPWKWNLGLRWYLVTAVLATLR